MQLAQARDRQQAGDVTRVDKRTTRKAGTSETKAHMLRWQHKVSVGTNAGIVHGPCGRLVGLAQIPNVRQRSRFRGTSAGSDKVLAVWDKPQRRSLCHINGGLGLNQTLGMLLDRKPCRTEL